jgi:sulfate adenylyltransferase large subunit
MAVVAPAPTSALALLQREQEEKGLLRFSTAGSVDDGKSTLIGRLLYDSKGVYEDQLASVREAKSAANSGLLDFALITDGLRAEREQGITIDVAYRYFATPKRKFIIADTPGHEQYTRNMATGASTANLAIILVDARNGVLLQSRRHAFIASLLGIQHMLVAVNKMDLVGFREDVFERIREDFTGFAARLQVPDLHFIPISALHGDNVVEKSERMPWFQGESLLRYLETVHVASDRNLTEMRFPVQYVLRPNQDFRGYAGQVASGVMKPGDAVMVLPSGNSTRIRSIVTLDGELPKAFPTMSVAVCLEDELDISRGDMLVSPSHCPQVTQTIDAKLVWMSHRPLDLTRQYLLKHTTQEVRASVREIRYRINFSTLEKEQAGGFGLNDIGAVVIETHRPVFVDPYRRNRITGSFILIDPISNETVAAGMITGRESRVKASGVVPIGTEAPVAGGVSLTERISRTGHRPAVVWLDTPEIARAFERQLFDLGCMVAALTDQQSGSILPELAAFAVSAGLIVVCTGSDALRKRTRQLLGPGAFVDSEGEDAAAVLNRLQLRGIIRSNDRNTSPPEW